VDLDGVDLGAQEVVVQEHYLWQPLLALQIQAVEAVEEHGVQGVH